MSRRWVIDLLGFLISARGKIQFHHLRSLEDIIYHLWISGVDQHEWVRRVQAALFLLEGGFNMHPREIARIYYDTVRELTPIQMEVYGLAGEVWSSNDAKEPDRRFGPLLGLYSCLYERFYPLLTAPFIAADALLRTKTKLQELISGEGRVRPSIVEKLEVDRGYPRGLLTAGLERHLRNSIAHGRYKVLSRELIQMEDRDPRSGRITWGPHVFDYYELRERVFQFQFTCEGLLTALIMFDVNNHQVIRERGFVTPRQLRRRLDIAEVILQGFAEAHGFHCEEVTEPDFNTLKIKVRISGERREHPEEILVGGSGWARRYTLEVRTEESPIRNQAYGLLQTTLDIHDSYGLVILEVLNTDGSFAGKVVADWPARQQIFERKKPIEEVRSLLTEDTLPDEAMPVVIRGIPRPA